MRTRNQLPFLHHKIETCPARHDHSLPVRCEATVDNAWYAQTISSVPGGERVRVYTLDISRLKQAEAALSELSQRLTYHVDHSPLAVIEWGPDMRLIRWSGEAERIFGWQAEEVLGKRMEERDGLISYANGANSYVRKPVDFVQFVEAMRQLGLYWLALNVTAPIGTGNHAVSVPRHRRRTEHRPRRQRRHGALVYLAQKKSSQDHRGIT